jgi:UDP-N-acetylglucosamine 2-epimerase
MKIVSVVGARPEFIQATPVSRVLRRRHCELLAHAGQHHDYRMSINAVKSVRQPVERPALYGDGRTSEAILAMLEANV